MDQYSSVHYHVTISMAHEQIFIFEARLFKMCKSGDSHHSSVYCSFCKRRSFHDMIKKVGPFKHASPFANPFCSLTKEVKSSLQKERSTTRVNFFLDKLFVSTLISAIMWDATKCHKNKRILFPILFFWNRKTNLCSHLSKKIILQHYASPC